MDIALYTPAMPKENGFQSRSCSRMESWSSILPPASWAASRLNCRMLTAYRLKAIHWMKAKSSTVIPLLTHPPGTATRNCHLKREISSAFAAWSGNATSIHSFSVKQRFFYEENSGRKQNTSILYRNRISRLIFREVSAQKNPKTTQGGSKCVNFSH